MKDQSILIVVTSHQELGKTGKLTGYYLPEVSHPFHEFEQAGYHVDIASIQGGKAPMDEKSRDLSDPINREFLEKHSAKLDNTLELGKIDPNQYQAILFAGGHGTMWDFPEAESVKSVVSEIYQNGGVVSALCHGPAALINIKLRDGSYLITGKRVTGFSNEEEEKAELTEVMPFLLEDALKARGAKYQAARAFQENVVVDGRLVTGQNPASASKTGKAVIQQLGQ